MSNQLIEILLKEAEISYIKEFRFYLPRRWRFDFSIPTHRIAVEYEGGTWAKGRHTRAKGYTNDCQKYNTAALLGWIVLRYTADMLKINPDRVITDIKMAMCYRAEREWDIRYKSLRENVSERLKGAEDA